MIPLTPARIKRAQRVDIGGALVLGVLAIVLVVIRLAV